MFRAAIKVLHKEDVTFDVVAEKENISPKASMATCSKEEIDNFVAAVKEVRKKSLTWGWCCVRVTAKYKSFTGDAYLGGCSYTSKDDFINNSGYMQQLCAEALHNLNEEIQLKFKPLEDLVIIKNIEN